MVHVQLFLLCLHAKAVLAIASTTYWEPLTSILEGGRREQEPMTKNNQDTGRHVFHRLRAVLSILVDLCVVASVLVIAFNAVFFRNAGPAKATSARSSVPLPTSPIEIEGSPRMGDRSASLALVVYSDFQCPFCARFATTVMPELVGKYVDTGKMLIAFKNMPLPMHEYAGRAAEASVCAHSQGRFWEFHDALFANPKALAEEDLKLHALRAGLDAAAFGACLAKGQEAAVRKDADEANLFGMAATPSFVVGSLRMGTVYPVGTLVGAQPASAFIREIERALKTTTGGQ